jgi:predicted DNA-binding ribbon-helix-helix protein
MTSAKPRRSAAWRYALGAVEKSRSGLISHNVQIGTRRTSLRLDALTWSALGDIARREQITLHELCTLIAETKPPALSLTVAVRCYALGYFCEAVTAEAGRTLTRRAPRVPSDHRIFAAEAASARGTPVTIISGPPSGPAMLAVVSGRPHARSSIASAARTRAAAGCG